MKTLSTLLLASLFLVFIPLQVMACGISPTAQIDAFPDNVVFVGTTMLFEGYGSSANCGYLTTFRWQVDGITVSTDPEYVASLTLPAGQSIKRYDVQLRVRNSGGLYGYTNVTIAIVRDHKSYYYLTDHLGSVRVTVNDAGAPVGWDDYYPFGLQMPGRTQNASNPNDDAKFTGYLLEQDGDLGLYHAEARMYDPVIGRFMQIDPMSEKFPSWSPYLYVGNDPVSYIDPTGKYRVHPAKYNDEGVVSLVTRLNLKTLYRDERAGAILGLGGPIGSISSAIKMAKMGMKQDNAWSTGPLDVAGLLSFGLLKFGKNTKDILSSVVEGTTLGNGINNSFVTADAGRDQVMFEVAKQFGGGGLFESGNGYAGYTNSLVLNQSFATAIENGRGREGLGDVTAFTKKFVGAAAGIITGIANSQGFDLTTEYGRKATLNHYQKNKKKYDNDIQTVFDMLNKKR